MLKRTIEPPSRWLDARASDRDPELGELFRSVCDPEPLSAQALAEVRERLASGRSRSPLHRRVRETVLVAVMLLGGASLALAGVGVSDWWQGRSAKAPLALEQRKASKVVARRTHSGVQSERSGAGPRPVEAEMPLPPALGRPAPPAQSTAESAAAERAAAPTPNEASALAAEAQALEKVLIKLRREHDAVGALALLDESRALFERGTLALEARVARIDALLMLGRRSEALQMLEHLPFEHVGRGGELRLLRAELRATNDCGHALSDFDVLVQQALPNALAERALYGRAACELQVGDKAHAEQDWQRYLQRFPEGRFATSVQKQLARSTELKPAP